MTLEVSAFSFSSWLTKKNFRGATQRLWFVYDAVEMQDYIEYHVEVDGMDGTGKIRKHTKRKFLEGRIQLGGPKTSARRSTAPNAGPFELEIE